MAGKDPEPPKEDNDLFSKPNISKQEKVDTTKPVNKININKNKPARQV